MDTGTTAMTDAQIIESLGGCTALGREFKRKPKSVHNWKSRGIPFRWRIQMVPIADRMRVALPADFLTRKG